MRMGVRALMSWMLSIRLPVEISRDEPGEDAVRDLVGEAVGDDEGAPLRLGDARGLAGERALEIGVGEDGGELLPERGVHRLGQLEDLAGDDPLGEEAELLRETRTPSGRVLP